MRAKSTPSYNHYSCPHDVPLLSSTLRFSTVGPVRASAPSPKSRCVSTVGPEALQRFTKTRPLHASLEQRHTTPSFHQQREVIRKQIRNKSLELARSQNEHDKSGRLFAYFVKDFNPKASMFYINRWYIDHNELIRIENYSHRNKAVAYKPLFHKGKRTHTLLSVESVSVYL